MYDKVAAVSGGAKGIGAAVSRLFCRRGYSVAIGYRTSRAAAVTLADELNAAGGKAVAVYADLSGMKGAEEFRRGVFGAFGRADVLVNNAGSCEHGVLAEFSEEHILRSVTDNLLAAVYASKAFYDDFAFGGSGSIVNISSVWGICGASTESVYSAAKAGVIAFTKSLAKELAPCGVRVNAVAPGVTDTDMLARFGNDERAELKNEIPLGRFASPGDIASVVYFLASDAASYITGQTFNVSGGYVI